jgi:hypothetical protein
MRLVRRLVGRRQVLSRRAASHSTVTEGPSQLRARARSQTGAGMGATSRAATEAAGHEATAGKLERQGRRQVNKISKEIDEAIANAIPLVASNAIALPITNKPLTGKSAAALMEKLNEQFAVVKHGGKVVILTFERHVQKVGRVEYARLVATFLRFSDFRNLLMHKRIKIGKKLIASGEWWLEQERRRQYDGLVPTFHRA